MRKSNGAYKIDIFDIVLIAGAYGSQGITIPGASWFLGCDVAPQAEVIDIFDVVTAAAHYGREWEPRSLAQTSGNITPFFLMQGKSY
ncbi:MAG: hypothetical protein JSV64_02270 [Candidatus Bathyarchaeota archaeon]|nr:MAG: hypothetical protein JSV64_02270 [Candidatus Bathyarchaeota archaeon]